jgi:hypothetical protein
MKPLYGAIWGSGVDLPLGARPGYQGRMSMTRDEWRPGRRSATAPPRQRNWGGAQELSLALATSQRRIGAPGAPPACAHCRRLAMRGLTVCRWHGGASIAARRAKARARRQGEGEGEGEGEGTSPI